MINTTVHVNPTTPLDNKRIERDMHVVWIGRLYNGHLSIIHEKSQAQRLAGVFLKERDPYEWIDLAELIPA